MMGLACHEAREAREGYEGEERWSYFLTVPARHSCGGAGRSQRSN